MELDHYVKTVYRKFKPDLLSNRCYALVIQEQTRQPTAERSPLLKHQHRFTIWIIQMFQIFHCETKFQTATNPNLKKKKTQLERERERGGYLLSTQSCNDCKRRRLDTAGCRV